MSVIYLNLTPQDPLIARDGRPFGAQQGYRMRSLTWPLPSVVAGSLRSALVKSNPQWDFTKITPVEVMRCEVAGVFPCGNGEMYFPAPQDAVAEPNEDAKTIKKVHRLLPSMDHDGCDLPGGLRPVLMPEGVEDFKPAKMPTWWPILQLKRWLLSENITFDDSFLNDPVQETRDHVCIDPQTGAAMESMIFSSTGLHLGKLPRFQASKQDPSANGYLPITLQARVTIARNYAKDVNSLNLLAPLGGERRLVHWHGSPCETQTTESSKPLSMWDCPSDIVTALKERKQGQGVRMVLATPAIFEHGWRPNWLNETTLQGKPFGDGPTLKLVAAIIPRWKAVSGWAMQMHEPREGEPSSRVVPSDKPGPKAIRRMVPAGAVYFFELIEGDPHILATNGWLKPISDNSADNRDGFGLAVWGIWNKKENQ